MEQAKTSIVAHKTDIACNFTP